MENFYRLTALPISQTVCFSCENHREKCKKRNRWIWRHGEKGQEKVREKNTRESWRCACGVSRRTNNLVFAISKINTRANGWADIVHEIWLRGWEAEKKNVSYVYLPIKTISWSTLDRTRIGKSNICSIRIQYRKNRNESSATNRIASLRWWYRYLITSFFCNVRLLALILFAILRTHFPQAFWAQSPCDFSDFVAKAAKRFYSTEFDGFTLAEITFWKSTEWMMRKYSTARASPAAAQPERIRWE